MTNDEKEAARIIREQLSKPYAFDQLSDDEIINLLKVEYHRLSEASKAYSLAEGNIRFLRQRCPHNEKQSWTDSDGFSGSFKVEKCLICGLQKDYGL